VDLLLENRVTTVADVRSSPYSRFCPQFNTGQLQQTLRSEGIQYVFLGVELGARREEPECYFDGVAKYELVVKTPAFAQGLQRLRAGLADHRIALLCAERDPLTCHRMILISRQLRNDVEIVHIIGPGECESQQKAETRLLKLVGLPDRDLFRRHEELLEEAYAKQGAAIAYRRESVVAANSSEGN
jgi:uncharacterized protein (DUF488 family)